MDEKFLELASELADKRNEQGIAAIAKNAIPAYDLSPEQYKRVDCSVCDEPLPEFRMKKGLEICVDCQTIRERAAKRLS